MPDDALIRDWHYWHSEALSERVQHIKLQHEVEHLRNCENVRKSTTLTAGETIGELGKQIGRLNAEIERLREALANKEGELSEN